MRVAFDHQAFCLQRTGGISRYFCELASALISANEDVKIFAPLYRNTYLRALPAARVQGYWVKDYPPYSAALCTRLIGRLASAALERWQPEVVHETYYSHRPSSSKYAQVSGRAASGSCYLYLAVDTKGSYSPVRRACFKDFGHLPWLRYVSY